MKNLFNIFLLSAVGWSCTHNTGTEKYQGKRDRIINVRDKVKEIKIDDVLLGNITCQYLIDDYLMISDYKSPDKTIHLFDKNTYRYVTSTAPRGQGPGEIAELGYTGIDEAKRRFYVTDLGKLRILEYKLDSVLSNPLYMPEEKKKLNESKFPHSYHYIHDTLCVGIIVEPVGNADFKQMVGKWNMATGAIEPMKYEHPGIEKKRIGLAVSTEHGIYVECYANYDLLTICTLDGELRYNIYERNQDNTRSTPMFYYNSVAFCGDKIMALYCGKISHFRNETGGITVNYPTQLIVFNLQGDYLQTLEVGYKINDFCYDKENNRLILTMNDDIQVGYLDLGELDF
ncbi:MAG: 6-bladed beta-propeller [Tannerellaceae bacterium]|jgi:hypothetical protein|nr:6-bladed beta-propeller [Tannerellaceae bacterium]